jgi:hypothetical protein
MFANKILYASSTLFGRIHPISNGCSLHSYIRQVVQSHMEPHVAFVHCAEPHGFPNCPQLFSVPNVAQSPCKTVIQQPEVRLVGRHEKLLFRHMALAPPGTTRPSHTFWHLARGRWNVNEAPSPICTSASYQAQAMFQWKIKSDTSGTCFFPCCFAQPIY